MNTKKAIDNGKTATVSKASVGDYSTISAKYAHADVDHAINGAQNYIQITSVSMPDTFQPLAAGDTYDIYVSFTDLS